MFQIKTSLSISLQFPSYVYYTAPIQKLLNSIYILPMESLTPCLDDCTATFHTGIKTWGLDGSVRADLRFPSFLVWIDGMESKILSKQKPFQYKNVRICSGSTFVRYRENISIGSQALNVI